MTPKMVNVMQESMMSLDKDLETIRRKLINIASFSSDPAALSTLANAIAALAREQNRVYDTLARHT